MIVQISIGRTHNPLAAQMLRDHLLELCAQPGASMTPLKYVHSIQTIDREPDYQPNMEKNNA
jgi:hypothetical protein